MIRSIAPYLILNGGGKEAVRFYEQALDAQVLHLATYGDVPPNPEYRLPDDAKERIMHAHLKVGDSDLMLSDTFPGPQGDEYRIGTQVSIAVFVSDPDKAREVFGKLQDGGQVVMPLQETFWSPLYGQVTDKYGVTWQISSEKAQENEG
jgi:PhnB protein